MRGIALVIFLSIISSCSNYVSSDLNGRWRTIIDDQYYELWINNDLVLDWSDITGDIIIRRFKIDGDNMIFSTTVEDNLEPSNTEFILRIINLNKHSISTELLTHPDHPQYEYDLIDKDVPYFNVEIYNSELYETYRKELIDRGNQYLMELKN